jgi:hypothetical protein
MIDKFENKFATASVSGRYHVVAGLRSQGEYLKAECRIASAASASNNAPCRKAVDAKFSFPSRAVFVAGVHDVLLFDVNQKVLAQQSLG